MKHDFTKADIIKRELGDVNVKNIVTYLAAIGWEVSWYSPGKKNDNLENLGLVSYAEERNAFLYSVDSLKILFIREGLIYPITHDCLLHELGHIQLQHPEKPTIEQEKEADLFAAYLNGSIAHEAPVQTAVKPKKKSISPKLIIAACSALLIVAVLVTSQFWKTPATALPAQLPSPPLQNVLSETEPEAEGTVFISSGGDKYHLEDCRYVSGKPNVVEITLEEAANLGKEPCSVCKP